jgi:hypothetical protein
VLMTTTFGRRPIIKADPRGFEAVQELRRASASIDSACRWSDVRWRPGPARFAPLKP